MLNPILTESQNSRLESWIAGGMPTALKKIGYSNGSRGNDNYHSTYAFRRPGGKYLVERFFEDNRSTYRRLKSKYPDEPYGAFCI